MEKIKQEGRKKEFKRWLEKKQKRKFETGRENNAKSVTDKINVNGLHAPW